MPINFVCDFEHSQVYFTGLGKAAEFRPLDIEQDFTYFLDSEEKT